jgi:hypothetical protein
VEQDGVGDWVDVDHGIGHVNEFASDCFGPMLAMGFVAAERKVRTAAVLASNLPITLAAMSAGDLDIWRATIIATELCEASPETCAACWAAIDDLAHRMRGDDPTRTLEQCRADAFVDLVLNNATVTTTVTLMIPVQTATPCNLASLCKHHHRVKHRAGWARVMTRDSTCGWTDPHGRQYATHPTNHHDLAA